jgi:hypothetical protein
MEHADRLWLQVRSDCPPKLLLEFLTGESGDSVNQVRLPLTPAPPFH